VAATLLSARPATRLAQRVQLQEGGRLIGDAHLERRLVDLDAVVLGRNQSLGRILVARRRVHLQGRHCDKHASNERRDCKVLREALEKGS
jgi:hypothetical protein